MNQKKKKKGLIAGIIVGAVVFVVGSSIIGFTLLGTVICLAVGAGAGWAVSVMAQGLDLSQKEHHGTAAVPFQVENLDPKVKETVIAGQGFVEDISRLNRQIPDEALSAKMDTLEENVNKIFSTLAEQPDKLPQARKFINYYLPTTVKLLSGYAQLDKHQATGANVENAKKRIVETMDLIIRASEKQQECLYSEDTLDMETDMDVLEQMVKRDGLSDVDFAAIRDHMEKDEPVPFDFDTLHKQLDEDKVH